MTLDEKRLLEMLFYLRDGVFFEVIDEDGFRKPAISTELTKELDDTEMWKVAINRRLLAKWFGM